MKTSSDQAASEDVQSLITLLANNEATAREKARNSLVLLGNAAVIPLIEELSTSSVSRVCWEAAKALGSIKDPAAANALTKALAHQDDAVRWVAAEALIALGADGLKQTLVVLLTNAGSVQLRQAARHVISHFAHRHSGELLRPLLARFQAFEPAVAIPPEALHALHEMDRGTLNP